MFLYFLLPAKILIKIKKEKDWIRFLTIEM